MSKSGRIVLGVAIAVVVALVPGALPHAQGTEKQWGTGSVQQVPFRSSMTHPYRLVDNWAHLKEQGMSWGGAIGNIPDGKGGLWVLQRSSPAILHLDASGKVLKAFAEHTFAQAHGFCQDRDGNFWAGDAGPFNDGATDLLNEVISPAEARARAHVVRKFSPEGKLLLTVGTPGVAKAGPGTFIMPAACISMPNGNILVADGHMPRPTYAQQDGDRLVELTRDGKFVRDYLKRGSGPGEMWAVHGQMAYDSQGRLFLADRSNNRIQILDKNMNFVDEWRHFGRPSAVVILKDDTLLVTDSESKYQGFPPTEAWKPFTNTRQTGWQTGIRIGSAKDGSLKYFISDTDPEGLAADELGNVWGGLIVNCHPRVPNKPCIYKWVKK